MSNATRMAPTIRRLRIAHFTSRYPIPSHTFIAREVRELRRLGTEVHTFTVEATRDPAGLSDLDRTEIATTTSLRPVSPWRLASVHARALRKAPRAWFATLWLALHSGPPGPRGLLWQLFYFAQALLFADHCAGRRLAHVHVHHANVAADVTWLACEFGRRSQMLPRTWSLTIHGPTEFDDPSMRPAPKARAADAVVTISDYTRSRLVALDGAPPASAVEVVPLGIELERIPFREPHAAPTPVRVLNVAQLVARKGHADLLRALAAADVELQLTLVGDGPERPRLEALARELDLAVAFRGALGEDATLAAYAEADLFCLTSYAEGLPVVLMEAMAAGVPVIATRVAGVPELVIDRETGLLVEPGQVQEITTAVEQLVADAQLRHSVSERARARVEQRHDLRRSVARLLEVMQRA